MEFQTGHYLCMFDRYIHIWQFLMNDPSRQQETYSHIDPENDNLVVTYFHFLICKLIQNIQCSIRQYHRYSERDNVILKFNITAFINKHLSVLYYEDHMKHHGEGEVRWQAGKRQWIKD